MIVVAVSLQGILMVAKPRPEALATKSNFAKNNRMDKEECNKSVQKPVPEQQ